MAEQRDWRDERRTRADEAQFGDRGGRGGYEREGSQARYRSEGRGSAAYGEAGAYRGEGDEGYGDVGIGPGGYDFGPGQGRGGRGPGLRRGYGAGGEERNDRLFRGRGDQAFGSGISGEPYDRSYGEEQRSWESTARNDYRGRGPKNYTRSDDRIREDVCDRLADAPDIDASDVEVQVASGEVTLIGLVGDRRAKRRAEDCAEDVSGVTHVQNNLRVRQGQSADDASSATREPHQRSI